MIRWSLILFSVALTVTAGERLWVGEVLPSVGGETLSGKEVELPVADAGKPRVLVFSFTKKAGADSKLWNERIARDFGSHAPIVFRVIFLESVPKMFRGKAVSGIKSGLPETVWDRSLVLYKDADSWRYKLVVTGVSHAYLVLLDGQGKVLWMSSRAFNEPEYADLKKALAH
jgi:hypothetical protein